MSCLGAGEPGLDEGPWSHGGNLGEGPPAGTHPAPQAFPMSLGVDSATAAVGTTCTSACTDTEGSTSDRYGQIGLGSRTVLQRQWILVPPWAGQGFRDGTPISHGASLSEEEEGVRGSRTCYQIARLA